VCPVPIPPLEPKVTFPVDEGLPGLLRLFDSEWVWRTYCAEFGEPEESPQCFRALQMSYRPGARALVSYVAEWKRGRWVEEDQFAVELVAGSRERLFRQVFHSSDKQVSRAACGLRKCKIDRVSRIALRPLVWELAQ
jgi:hypothetical protein